MPISAPPPSWASIKNKPNTVVGFGISDVLANSQTWQDLTASRAAATTYTNTTGKPIAISVYMLDLAGNANASLAINGVTVANNRQSTSIGFQPYLFGIIPAGGTYIITLQNYSVTRWSELR